MFNSILDACSCYVQIQAFYVSDKLLQTQRRQLCTITYSSYFINFINLRKAYPIIQIKRLFYFSVVNTITYFSSAIFRQQPALHFQGEKAYGRHDWEERHAGTTFLYDSSTYTDQSSTNPKVRDLKSKQVRSEQQ